MEIQGRSELAKNEAAPVENEVLYLDKARWLLKYEQILSNRDVYIYIYMEQSKSNMNGERSIIDSINFV